MVSSSSPLMEGAATSLEDVNNRDDNLDCFEYTDEGTKACVVAIKARRSWIVLIIIISFILSSFRSMQQSVVVGSWKEKSGAAKNSVAVDQLTPMHSLL